MSMYTTVVLIADWVPDRILTTLVDEGFEYPGRTVDSPPRRLLLGQRDTNRNVWVGEANHLPSTKFVEWVRALDWPKYTAPQYMDEGGGRVTLTLLHESGPLSVHAIRGPHVFDDKEN